MDDIAQYVSRLSSHESLRDVEMNFDFASYSMALYYEYESLKDRKIPDNQQAITHLEYATVSSIAMAARINQVRHDVGVEQLVPSLSVYKTLEYTKRVSESLQAIGRVDLGLLATRLIPAAVVTVGRIDRPSHMLSTTTTIGRINIHTQTAAEIESKQFKLPDENYTTESQAQATYKEKLIRPSIDQANFLNLLGNRSFGTIGERDLEIDADTVLKYQIFCRSVGPTFKVDFSSKGNIESYLTYVNSGVATQVLGMADMKQMDNKNIILAACMATFEPSEFSLNHYKSEIKTLPGKLALIASYVTKVQRNEVKRNDNLQVPRSSKKKEQSSEKGKSAVQEPSTTNDASRGRGGFRGRGGTRGRGRGRKNAESTREEVESKKTEAKPPDVQPTTMSEITESTNN